LKLLKLNTQQGKGEVVQAQTKNGFRQNWVGSGVDSWTPGSQPCWNQI